MLIVGRMVEVKCARSESVSELSHVEDTISAERVGGGGIVGLGIDVLDAVDDMRRATGGDADSRLEDGGRSSIGDCGAGSMSALNASASTNGSVSTENANASSSAYTSNNRGRLSKPSATRWIVCDGEREKEGIWGPRLAFVSAAFHTADVAYVLRWACKGVRMIFWRKI